MKRAELGMVLRYSGELMEVIGISEGKCVILAHLRQSLSRRDA